MIRPQGKRLLITIPEKKESTASGIIIPETAMDNAKIKCGTVAEVPDFQYTFGTLEHKYHVGELVYFSINNTETITDGNTEYLIVSMEDILAIKEIEV